MKAVILAAGYATRLYPLTQNMPKCLLEVGDRTILDALCEKLEAVPDIDEVLIVTNARFYPQFEAWKRGFRGRLPVRVFDDGTTSNDDRLGAIGDLGLVLKEARVKSDLLLLASDNLFEQGLETFLSFARSKKDAVVLAVYDIGDKDLAAGKFGVIESDASGKVLTMEEKPAKPRSSFIGMGVYYFPAATLPKTFEYLAAKDAQDAPGHYMRWLLGKVKIFSFQFFGMWYDIGDLEALEEARRLFQPKK